MEDPGFEGLEIVVVWNGVGEEKEVLFVWAGGAFCECYDCGRFVKGCRVGRGEVLDEIWI